MSLLEIRDYRLAFDTFDGTLHVLDGIDLSLEAGETLGIVGETGCGKSVLARSLLRLNEAPPARVVSGAILFEGQDVLSLPEKATAVDLDNNGYVDHVYVGDVGGQLWKFDVSATATTSWTG